MSGIFDAESDVDEPFGDKDNATKHSEDVFTVGELSRAIKALLEEEPKLQRIWVKGETSRVTYHSSGHLYFSLKDESAVINAIMWKSQAQKMDFRLKEGVEVLLLGNVSSYPARSSYQILAQKIIPEGLGRLQQKIQALKIKLMEEGLFENSRKKELPFLPRRIGVVTSPTGAALRDVIRVLRSRYENCDILIAPCEVQGEGSPASIIRALSEIQKDEWSVDEIILCRGGGSLEDLMAFNEENVVRAVASARIPVITGIGHEIDFTLCDFAADKRGATPSQAAELAVADSRLLEEDLAQIKERLKNSLQGRLNRFRESLEERAKHRFLRNPRNYITEQIMRIDDLESKLKRNIAYQRESWQASLDRYARIPERIRHLFSSWEKELALSAEKLEGLSPLKAISRGYAYVVNSEGKIITGTRDINVGERIQVRITDAKLSCRIEEIEKNP